MAEVQKAISDEPRVDSALSAESNDSKSRLNLATLSQYRTQESRLTLVEKKLEDIDKRSEIAQQTQLAILELLHAKLGTIKSRDVSPLTQAVAEQNQNQIRVEVPLNTNRTNVHFTPHLGQQPFRTPTNNVQILPLNVNVAPAPIPAFQAIQPAAAQAPAAVPAEAPNIQNPLPVRLQPMHVTTTTMVTEYKVPEDQKMIKLTLKGYRRIKKLYDVYKATALDQSKNLANWISTDCLEKLVANEKRLQTPFSALVNNSNIYTASDLDMHHVICRMLRPLTITSYIEQMVKNVNTLKALNADYTTLTVIDYDINLHVNVNTLLDMFLDFDEIFRTAATEMELQQLPKVDYGKKENPGVFRVLMSRFGKFQDHFTKKISFERLKTIPNLLTLVLEIKNINNNLATEAIRIRQSNAALQPVDKNLLDDLSSRITRDNGDDEHDRTRRTPTNTRSTVNVLDNASRRSVTFGLVTRHQISDEENQDVDEIDEQQNSEEDDEEEIVDEDEDTYVSGPNRNPAEDLDRLMLLTGRAAYPAPPKGKQYDNNRNNNSQRNLKNHPPLPAFEAEGPKICFAMFRHGVCSEGAECKYSHKKGDLRGYGNTLKKYVDSLPHNK